MSETLLARALSLSQAMLAAAAAAEWERFTQLQEEREPLLSQAFEAGERDEATLRTLIDCNRQLCDEVARARDKVAQEWQWAQGRSQAIAAYSQN